MARRSYPDAVERWDSTTREVGDPNARDRFPYPGGAPLVCSSTLWRPTMPANAWNRRVSGPTGDALHSESDVGRIDVKGEARELAAPSCASSWPH
jgi:hypothetical protein